MPRRRRVKDEEYRLMAQRTDLPQSPVSSRPCNQTSKSCKCKRKGETLPDQVSRRKHSYLLRKPYSCVDCQVDPADLVRIIVDHRNKHGRDEIERCPICLSTPPIAPRMLECGHIYCLPCLLLLRQTGSPTQFDAMPRCVFCKSLLTQNLGYPVLFVAHQSQREELKTGTTVVLELHKGNLRSGRFVKAQAESDDLGHFRIATENQATRHLEDERYALASMKDACVTTGEDHHAYEMALVIIDKEIKEATLRDLDSRHEAADGDCKVFCYCPRNHSRVFLSTLDIKLLLEQFGSYSSLPEQILCKVEGLEPVCGLKKDQRDKQPQFRHLPLGTSIVIMHADWNGSLDLSILERNRHELDCRRKSREQAEQLKESPRSKSKPMDYLQNSISDEDELDALEDDFAVLWHQRRYRKKR